MYLTQLKMTPDTGVLFYSYSNEVVDYRLLTNYATDLVHQYLDLPVCVVTDNTDAVITADFVRVVPKPKSTSRFYHDAQKAGTWYNLNRCGGLEHSPFRYTLALDVDYLVMSKNLAKFVGPGVELLVPRTAYELGAEHNLTLTPFNNFGLPSYWATVMSWDRESLVAQLFFRHWRSVAQHWTHYAALFGLNGQLFRNDFAVTIALYLLHGKRWSCDHDMPYTLLHLPSRSTEQDVGTAYKGYLDVDLPWTTVRVSDYDVHAMNKKNLLELLNV